MVHHLRCRAKEMSGHVTVFCWSLHPSIPKLCQWTDSWRLHSKTTGRILMSGMNQITLGIFGYLGSFYDLLLLLNQSSAVKYLSSRTHNQTPDNKVETLWLQKGCNKHDMSVRPTVIREQQHTSLWQPQTTDLRTCCPGCKTQLLWIQMEMLFQ